MADLVVTVPKELWADWIAEGDAAGSPETGETWGFQLSSQQPPIDIGDRLYIVAHGRLRGYAPVTKVALIDGRWWVGRKGGAVAVTVPFPIPGFRGWRRKWWKSSGESPFPAWEFAGVDAAMATEIVDRHRFTPSTVPNNIFGDAMRLIREQCETHSKVTTRDMFTVFAERFGLRMADAEVLAIWAAEQWLRWLEEAMGREVAAYV
jgi:hypothetical protein